MQRTQSNALVIHPNASSNQDKETLDIHATGIPVVALVKSSPLETKDVNMKNRLVEASVRIVYKQGFGFIDQAVQALVEEVNKLKPPVADPPPSSS